MQAKHLRPLPKQCPGVNLVRAKLSRNFRKQPRSTSGHMWSIPGRM